MRIFYIFNIKNEFFSLYKEKPSELFKILKHIYLLDTDEVKYAVTLLDQLENKFNKSDIDTHLFIKLHREMPYSKRGDIHYFNNLYTDEVSRLIVKNRYIKIMSDSINSSFFDILKDISANYFVCDFDNSFFFFLYKVKSTCLYT